MSLDCDASNSLPGSQSRRHTGAGTITVTFFAEGLLNGEKAQAAGTLVTHGVRVPQAPEKGLSE